MQRRILAVCGVLAVGAAGVSGCALQEGGAAASKPVVSIGIDASSPEQIVLGEIYSQVLRGQGRPTAVTAVNYKDYGGALEVLKTQRVDFLITCTGVLLEDEDPAAAARLAADADGEGEFSERVYDAAVGTLPSGLRTVDPSPAQGCASVQREHDTLPTNVIPVFKDAVFNRSELQRLNFMTRVMSTTDVQSMAEDLEKGTPLDDTIADWLLEYAQIDIKAGGGDVDKQGAEDDADARSGDPAAG